MNASDHSALPSVPDELASAMEWWREAGVDYDFSDDVTDWLASSDAPRDAGAANATPEPPQSPLLKRQKNAAERQENADTRFDFFKDHTPSSLEEFREFWLNAPGLDAIGPRGRVAPRGDKDAELMVLVVDPEERDRNTLLSGPQGMLLDKILKAMGTAPGEVYVASALPRHTPMADTAALAASGLDRVLHHHVTLANPRKILAFGARLSPFIAQNATPNEMSLRESNYVLAQKPTLASEGLEALIETPPLKARFWRRWMEWSADK
ncbi:MAG: uracil-DNA glycosylase family protein [Pseudomonadota bacterium]